MRARLVRAAIVCGLGVATLAYGALEKSITVSVEGEPLRIRTFAATVGEALDRAGIPVGARDRLEPAASAPVDDGTVVAVYRAKPVTLLLDGERRKVWVTGLTIAEVLEEVKARSTLADLVHPSRASRVTAGMTISVRRAVAVKVRHDGRTERVVTNARSIGRVVRELGIELGRRDQIRPRARTSPRQGMTIRVLRVGIRRDTRMEDVAFPTYLRRTNDLRYGQRKTVQSGREGLRRVQYVSRYVDGKLVSRRAVHATTIKPARPRIIAIGAYRPTCDCRDGVQVGGASWYHRNDGLTAAHKTLPFGTMVKVTNLDNGRVVYVKIVDRGPYIDGRVIDLSDDAFSRLAPLSKGVIRVRIRW